MPLEPWDLKLVLGVLQEAPFEPLQEVSLSFLSRKVAFLVAVIRRVSELATLSFQVLFLNFHQHRWQQHNTHGPVSPKDWLGEKDFTIFLSHTGVKRTWSKPFRIRGLSRREKDTHPVEHTEPDCVDLPDVDEEGFTRRPDDHVTKESSIACCSSSDSDFDDDDEDEPRRYRIQIKPPQSAERVEDEEAKMKRLRETVGSMIQPPAAVVSVRRQTIRTVSNSGTTSAELNCHTDKPNLGFTNTSPSSGTNSSDSNSVCGSHPGHCSFGAFQETGFEPDDFPVCRTYNLASSPSPFSSSSPENVEDSGLDSPFHPFSGPSPDSRPWTPRDDCSTGDSVLVTPSFADSPSDLTTSHSAGQQLSEKRDTWEHKVTAPSPPLPGCTTGATELFSPNHGQKGRVSFANIALVYAVPFNKPAEDLKDSGPVSRTYLIKVSKGVNSSFILVRHTEKLTEDGNLILQQDLAPVHTVKSTNTWFKNNSITVLDWPANLPDLNPIDSLWGTVKRKKRETIPNNTEELMVAIKATWASITPQQCNRLIASMPRRIDVVIDAKGAPTKY
ncbi:unnamed protein product [Ranitomeya imitator]|uniref:Tc1-like transposase DDE domain-containing protein n=1 Tax=Ranitomeya imitator TaxID=111125 RepID=A0ABN9LIL6_9NEOB|nr:unnamed protein product [Ranitomeya imitator]